MSNGYNELASNIGTALIILAFFLGFGGCVRLVMNDGPLIVHMHGAAEETER